MATEKRLIWGDIAEEHLMKLAEYYKGSFSGDAFERAANEIRELPSVDAVEVVRCKDCKHYDNSEGIQWCHLNSKFARHGLDWHSFPEDGFCSYGERKDNG